MKRKLFICFALAMMVCILLPIPATAKKKIKLNASKLTLKEGKTYKLKLLYTKGKIKWKSSSKKVASVSSVGKVKAKKEGTAVITAKYKKKKYKCRIKVTAASDQYTADRLTVNNDIFTKERYQSIKKLKGGWSYAYLEVTKKKDVFAIYSSLAEATLKQTEDAGELMGGTDLSFEMKDGTKFEVGINKYLYYNGKCYSTPDGLADKVSAIVRKYSSQYNGGG